MELTEEQIEFLDKVCFGREKFQSEGEVWAFETGSVKNPVKFGRECWELNSNGEVDVDGDVDMSNMNLTEIPVKFGRVEWDFSCANNRLTSLKNCPEFVGGIFNCHSNNLTDYFKSIKEEDFTLSVWLSLYCFDILGEYPFLINIGKKYWKRDELVFYILNNPQIKFYLE
jgi:hypothetical protein